MGVVINEFEVLSDPRGGDKNDAGGAGKSQDEAPAKLDPHDLEAAQRQLQRRALRIWAH